MWCGRRCVVCSAALDDLVEFAPVKPDTPVIELPNTGSGISEQGGDWLIPGALGAAAAAIAAQKLLGDKAKESDETA